MSFYLKITTALGMPLYSAGFGISVNGEEVVLQGKALSSNRFVKDEIAAELLVTRKKSAPDHC